MNSKFFDVIVLGENLSGLIAATLLARRKYSVLLIRCVSVPGREDHLGRCIRRSHPIFPGFFDYPVPTAIIRELNLGHRFRSVFKPSSPLFQVVGSANRLTINDDRKRLTMEFSREFGSSTQAAEIVTMLEHLEECNELLDQLLIPELAYHAESMRDKWELSSHLKDFNKRCSERADLFTELDRLWSGTRLGRCIATVEGFAGDAGDGNFDKLFAYRRGAGMFSEILCEASGESIEDILQEKFEKYGGRILDASALDNFVAGRSGFRFSDKTYDYGSDALICNLDYFLLPEIFKGKKIDRYLSNQLSKIKPTQVWIKTSLMLKRRVIPEGMGHNLFLVSDDEPLTFYHRDPMVAAEVDVERLDIHRPLDIANFNAGGTKKLRNAVMNQARWLIPFLDENVEKVYVESAPDRPDETFGVDLAGRRLVYERLEETDCFGGVSYHLPFRNAYLAGPEVMPELGMEGEFITGWTIVRQICKKLPKKDALR